MAWAAEARHHQGCPPCWNPRSTRSLCRPATSTRSLVRSTNSAEGSRPSVRLCRHRAVIEQAKGIISALTGEDPGEAFRRLVQRSQQTNRKRTHVAAGIVTQAVRMPAEARPTAIPLLDDPDPAQRDAQLVASALSTAEPHGEQLAQTLMEELAELHVAAAAVVVDDGDGSLRLVGYEGSAKEHASASQRFPVLSDVPLADAVASGCDIFLSSQAERIARYPGARKLKADQLQSSATLRLRLGHTTVGSLTPRSDLSGWRDSTAACESPGGLEIGRGVLAQVPEPSIRDASTSVAPPWCRTRRDRRSRRPLHRSRDDAHTTSADLLARWGEAPRPGRQRCDALTASRWWERGAASRTSPRSRYGSDAPRSLASQGWPAGRRRRT